MSLARVSSVLRSVSVPRTAVQGMTTRFMATEGSFKKKEQAEEASYFNKKDEQALRKLLSKMRAQANQSDGDSAKQHEATEKKTLKKIVSKYNVSEDDLDALIRWKHE